MLAIVIPYYKFTFFEETLHSLMNQTNQRFKVYICDDASEKSPLTLLEKYEGKFDFVYHRFEENFGAVSLVKQWERCIERVADEDWIMILGDDDFLGENVIDSFYANLNEIIENDISVVRFSSIIKIENSDFKKPKFTHPKFEKISDFYYRKFSGKTRSSLSEYIFDKKAYIKKKFTEYPLAWHSDDKGWLDFSLNKPIFSINEAEIVIRVSEHSISGRIDYKEQKDAAEFQFFSYLIEKEWKKFSKETKVLILKRFELVLKNQKKNAIKYYLTIIIKYFKIGLFMDGIRFFRRMLINLFL